MVRMIHSRTKASHGTIGRIKKRAAEAKMLSKKE